MHEICKTKLLRLIRLSLRISVLGWCGPARIVRHNRENNSPIRIVAQALNVKTRLYRQSRQADQFNDERLLEKYLAAFSARITFTRASNRRSPSLQGDSETGDGLSAFRADGALHQIDEGQVRSLCFSAQIVLAMTEAVDRGLFPPLPRHRFAGEEEKALRDETPANSGKGRRQVAEINHRVGAHNEIIRRTGCVQLRLEVAENKLVIDAPFAGHLEHSGRHVDPVKTAAGSDILEGFADQARAAAQIEYAQAPRAARQYPVGERADMQMAAVAKAINHQFVETRRDAVEHLAQREVGNARDPALLHQHQEAIVLRGRQVRLQSQRAVVTDHRFIEPPHCDKHIAAIVPGDRIVGVEREHTIKRGQSLVQTLQLQKYCRAVDE